MQFCAVLAGTLFADPDLTRTFLHADGKWVKMSDTDRGDNDRALTHYPVQGGPEVKVPPPWGKGGVTADADVVAVTSADGKYLFAVAWPHARSILSNAHIPCIHADPLLPFSEAGRRLYVRGKLYLMEGTLDDLYRRVERDILPPDSELGSRDRTAGSRPVRELGLGDLTASVVTHETCLTIRHAGRSLPNLASLPQKCAIPLFGLWRFAGCG